MPKRKPRSVKRRAKKQPLKSDIGVLDFETDPFKYGHVPQPFAAGIYFAPNDYALLWDSTSRPNSRTQLAFIKRVIAALKQLPECILYAHNGGKFDFHYLLEYADFKDIVIRNGRVVKMKIGKVTLMDSFPLMPFALAEFRKTKINYDLFWPGKRNKPRNRALIESYLYDDCKDLHELINGFKDIVGPKDTIGGAAFYQMKQLGIKIQSMNEAHDDLFRPYYFGGRTEAFEKGVYRGAFKYLDINSAYPFAMKQDHPHGGEYVHSTRLPAIKNLGAQFIRARIVSKGALPLRSESGHLSFPHGEFEFNATGWEIRAGLETKTIRIIKVMDVWKPQQFINFSSYVDTFFAKRAHAKKVKDQIGALAYKYLLNSGYGKFAQNPRDFRDFCIAKYGKNVKGWDWECDFGALSIWSRPSYRGTGFYDVCTGASITGFVRALLWRSICASKRVIYVDTDAMLCEASKVKQGAELGQWKLEGIVKRVAIAGKKLYGVEWERPQGDAKEKYKIASKGARLSFQELLELCRGKEIVWNNDAPTFSLGQETFISRTIRAT